MDAGTRHLITTGVLLAADAGTRPGRGPKALLHKADGETLLESALGALQAGGCTHVVVVLSAEAGRVAERWRKPRTPRCC